jgi:hypothetical protein
MIIFSSKIMAGHINSCDSKVLARIKRHDAGWVFSAADFRDLGSPTAIRLALLRHSRRGTIRKAARGLYHRPRHLLRIGEIGPSTDAVVQAIARRDAVRYQPTGAYAANLLGLSDQVPARPVFLTDGRNRAIQLGRLTVTFRRTTPRNMATAGTISGLVIQALRFMGQRHIDDSSIAILRRRLRPADRQRLAKDAVHAPAWVAAVMLKVSTGASEET